MIAHDMVVPPAIISSTVILPHAGAWSLLYMQLSFTFITSHFLNKTRTPISAWSADQDETRLPVNL